MYLIPALYSRLVRPKFSIKKYIEPVLCEENDFRGKAVLDFACGTGDLAYLCDPTDYLGVDVDDSRIAYAKKQFPNYEFKKITNGIPAPDHSFDIVLVVAALHHISDTDCRSYVSEFSRLLKPGGKIIGIEPCKYNQRTFSNWYMDVVDNGAYIRIEEAYKKLYADHFLMVTKKKFTKYMFYRELFYEAASL